MPWANDGKILPVPEVVNDVVGEKDLSSHPFRIVEIGRAEHPDDRGIVGQHVELHRR